MRNYIFQSNTKSYKIWKRSPNIKNQGLQKNLGKYDTAKGNYKIPITDPTETQIYELWELKIILLRNFIELQENKDN